MEIQVLLPIAVVFLAMASATATAVWLLTDPQVAQRRLARVTTTPTVAAQGSLLDDATTPGVKRVRAWLPKSPKEMNRLQRQMASAGHHSAWAVILFATVQILLPVACFAAVIVAFGSGTALPFAFIAGGIGYFLPKIWLGRAIEARRREIRNGLPDAIDLLIVCIESGSGIDQAISRVAEELALPYPALAAELELICVESRAGKPRLEAFKNFAERTKVDDVRSLVAMLVQTDRFGTSLGLALRTHADTSRTKRRQRAEEKAAKLGVKLLFPLVFCLFPAFYVVVLGPSMVRIFRQFVFGSAFN